MRFAIVENGIVTNIVVSDLDFSVTQGWIPAGAARIGDRYENGQFLAPARWQSLDAGKYELNAAVNTKRDLLETHGFPHAGLWFQSDERSVARINSTALTASSALMSGQNQPFPDWIAADNTALPVDAQGVLALQASLTAHAGALHAHGRALKSAINAATSIDELSMIDIEAGWP